MTPEEAIDMLNTFLDRWYRLNGSIVRSKAFDKEAAKLFTALTGQKPEPQELKAIGN